MIYVALTFATIIAFEQVRNYDFVSFDDDEYVADNSNVKAGLTRESIAWAFTKASAHNWHPLTWLSHMLDCQLFGTNAGRHHLTNLLLHILNTLLLFAILKRMTNASWQSAFVAGAFALHPLHVESVAWVSERKDVLSALFWMLTIAAYLRYVNRPSIKRYLILMVVFGLGLMAKQMLVTLPFVLLLMDYWPLGRLTVTGQTSCNKTDGPSLRRCILEKLPLLALAAAFSVMIYLVQQRTGTMKNMPLLHRIGNVLVAYVGYIGKTLWPNNLAVFYPHLGSTLPVWRISLAALLLLCITIAVVWQIRQRPYLAVGWFWYMGTLVPVIGLVQVGLQAMADRYTYVPLIGLFMIIAWGVPELVQWLPYRKTSLSLSAVVLLSALGVTTWHQVRYWRNSTTLYQHAIATAPNNWWAYDNLAVEFLNQNKLDEALTYFNQSLRINPNYAKAHSNLSVVLLSQGKFGEAIKHCTEALRIDPDYAEAHNNLGIALQSQGKLNEAIYHHQQAVQLMPNNANMHIILGKALQSQGKLNEAIVHYQQALRLMPNNADAHINLGSALLAQGQINDAVGHYNQALKNRPADADTRNNLGIALAMQGKTNEAISQFLYTLTVKPDHAEAHNNLALLLSKQGKFDDAIDHYRQALRISPDYADAHNNIGVALQSQGKFDEAISHFRKALQFNPNYAGALNGIASILVTHPDQSRRDVTGAIKLAERAAELTNRRDPTILNTLAAAYAAAGQLERATLTAQTALMLALAAGNDDLANQIRRRLESYKQTKP